MRTVDMEAQVPKIKAKILDKMGKPTGEILVLSVEKIPQIVEKYFRITLNTLSRKYIDYTVQIALQNENGRLELCSIHFRDRDGKISASALVLIDNMIAHEESLSGYIPIELLDVRLYPNLH